jgi:hypothetical protein
VLTCTLNISGSMQHLGAEKRAAFGIDTTANLPADELASQTVQCSNTSIGSTDLRHDPAIVAQEVERAQALDVQVDVDAAVLVQEEQAHRVGALQAQASTLPMEDAGIFAYRQRDSCSGKIVRARLAGPAPVHRRRTWAQAVSTCLDDNVHGPGCHICSHHTSPGTLGSLWQSSHGRWRPSTA